MSWLPLASAGIGAAGNIFGGKSSQWSGQKATPEKIHKLESLNSGQKKLLDYINKHPDIKMPDINQNQMYQQGQGYLSNILNQNPYDPQFLEQFQKPYMREFQEQTVPGLAERFSSLGARNSSAFGQALGSAGASLAERLASLAGGIGMQRQQMGQEAAGQAFNYAQLPFNQEYERQGLNLKRQNLALGTQPFQYHVTPGQQASPGMGSGFSNAALKYGTEGILGGIQNSGGIGNWWKSLFG